jgi:hypothetical protein
MISVGDSVWIEEETGDELDDVCLAQLKVIEIKQRVLLGIEGVFFKLEDGNWYAREEIYLNKKDLVKSLIKQNKENQEELLLDIQAIIHELEDLKEKARLFGSRQDILNKLKETI